MSARPADRARPASTPPDIAGHTCLPPLSSVCGATRTKGDVGERECVAGKERRLREDGFPERELLAQSLRFLSEIRLTYTRMPGADHGQSSKHVLAFSLGFDGQLHAEAVHIPAYMRSQQPRLWRRHCGTVCFAMAMPQTRAKIHTQAGHPSSELSASASVASSSIVSVHQGFVSFEMKARKVDVCRILC